MASSLRARAPTHVVTAGPASTPRTMTLMLLLAHVTAKGAVYGRSHTYRRRSIVSNSHWHIDDENASHTRLQVQDVVTFVIMLALLTLLAYGIKHARMYRLTYGSHLPGWPGSRRALLFAHSRQVLAFQADERGGRAMHHTNGDMRSLDELSGKFRVTSAAITCVNVTSNDIIDCGEVLRAKCPQLARLDLTNNDLSRLDADRSLPRALRVLVLRQNDLVELHGLSKLTRLIYLDAAHNDLKRWPCAGDAAPRHLLHLDLSHNNLTSLEGISTAHALRVALLANNDLEDIDDLAACAQLRIVSLADNNLGRSRLIQHRVESAVVLPSLLDLVGSIELTDLDLSANFLGIHAQHSLRAAMVCPRAAGRTLRLDLSRQGKAQVQFEEEVGNASASALHVNAKKNN